LGPRGRKDDLTMAYGVSVICGWETASEIFTPVSLHMIINYAIMPS
jgi:hypothetical protein